MTVTPPTLPDTYPLIRERIKELILFAHMQPRLRGKDMAHAWGVLQGYVLTVYGAWSPDMAITLSDGKNTTPFLLFDALKVEALKDLAPYQRPITRDTVACPKCKTLLSFRSIAGMRLKREFGKGYTFDARCDQCHIDYLVPAPPD